jgi:hypothetical protein
MGLLPLDPTSLQEVQAVEMPMSLPVVPRAEEMHPEMPMTLLEVLEVGSHMLLLVGVQEEGPSLVGVHWEAPDHLKIAGKF